MFADGSQRVEFTLQSQRKGRPDTWETLGTSRTLAGARKAMLMHAPRKRLGLA